MPCEQSASCAYKYTEFTTMRYSKVQPTDIDSAVQSGRTAQRESTKIGEDAVTVHDATTGKGRLCGRKRQDLAYFAENLSNS